MPRIPQWIVGERYERQFNMDFPEPIRWLTHNGNVHQAEMVRDFFLYVNIAYIYFKIAAS